MPIILLSSQRTMLTLKPLTKIRISGKRRNYSSIWFRSLQMDIILYSYLINSYWISMAGNGTLLPQVCSIYCSSWSHYLLDNFRRTILGSIWQVISNLYRFFNVYQWAKIVIAVICFLLAIMVLVIMCMYKNERKFQAIFLDYARTFLNENPTVFAYIPIYLIFTLGLVALIVWQHCCFTSKYAISKNFFNFNNVGILEVLNVLEFIWGLQFLKDSCKIVDNLVNFNVSGVATEWYWLNGKSDCYKPYRRLVCTHWGSVVGGSFFNAFF